jgi:hypothetical protein
MNKLIVIYIIFAFSCSKNQPAPIITATTGLSQGRYAVTSVSAGSKVLFAGGYDLVNYPVDIIDIYDISLNTWTTNHLRMAGGYLVAASIGNKVFFMRGDNATSTISDQVDILDVTDNSWSGATLSKARSHGAAAALGFKIFFAGGSDGYGSPIDDVDIFDSTSNNWTTARLSRPRDGLAAISAEAKVFFGGGQESYGQFLLKPSNIVDIYDINTDSWTVDTLSEPRTSMAAASIDTKVFFIGGYNRDGMPSKIIDIYDINTQTWSSDTLPVGILMTRLIAVSIRAKLIIESEYGDIYLFDNDSGRWSRDILPTSRQYISVTALGSKVFFAGGIETNNIKSNKVDILDINNNTWTTVPGQNNHL